MISSLKSGASLVDIIIPVYGTATLNTAIMVLNCSSDTILVNSDKSTSSAYLTLGMEYVDLLQKYLQDA